MVAFLLILTVALGALLWWTPRVTRPTVPLGVSVPSGRVADPVVTAAVRHYRAGVGAATALACVLIAVTGSILPSAASLGPLVAVAGGLLAYVTARRRIVTAKRRDRWYEGVPVRLTASVTREPTVRFRPLPHAVAIAVTVAGVVYGLNAFGKAPNPYPTHFQINGVPDAWAPVSYSTVLGPQVFAVALAVGIAVTGWAIARRPASRPPGGDPAGAARREADVATLTQDLAAWLNLVIALALTGTNALVWNDQTGSPVTLTVGALLIAILTAIGVFTWRVATVSAVQARALREAGSRAGVERPQSPDDDRYWKAGVLYYNRDDPAFLVSKRFGLGWTINLGHPAGLTCLLLLLALILSSVLFSTL